MNVPFRTDEYGKSFYIENENGLVLLPYKVGEYTDSGIEFSVSENVDVSKGINFINLSLV